MNICVKTGARVWVEEYGGMAPADLYLVADAIVAKFGCGNRIELDYSADPALASHQMRISRGLYREDLGFAVVPREDVQGELVL